MRRAQCRRSGCDRGEEQGRALGEDVVADGAMRAAGHCQVKGVGYGVEVKSG